MWSLLEYKTISIIGIAILLTKPVFSQTTKIDTTKTEELKEVTIVGKDPISEKYAVTKLNKLDIYFNPSSKGDPLKAITILPSSTNTNETANPVLRGASADRSRVYINGSPILNPVRNSQADGIGNFSLLNTEIIDKQYVYASNPPLTYSNSSGGIIEIETNKSLTEENIQLSAALGNLGFMINKKITKKAFFQLYANDQFSNLFIKLNKPSIPNLNSFSTHDMGLNLHVNINDYLSVNSFNYFINEQYSAQNSSLNYKSESKAKQNRFFSANNIDYIRGKSKFRLSTLIDLSDKNYSYGIINSEAQSTLNTISLSHKYSLSNDITLQYGYDFLNQNYDYNEIVPLYYYATNKDAPNYKNNQKVNFNYHEVYLYGDYKLNRKIGLSTGLRKNIFVLNKSDDFLSVQLSAFYNINRANRFILSSGIYHSYSTPNYYYHQISLLKSKQIALDYYLDKRKYNITAAIYYKNDAGDLNTDFTTHFNHIQSIGSEFGLQYDINRAISINISNTFLKQTGFLNNVTYHTNNNLRYFIKTLLSYHNSKNLTIGLSFNTRPGDYYTGVIASNFNADAHNYEPIFEKNYNSTYQDYYKIDLTINKIFSIKNNMLITYLSLNNLLNTSNKSSTYYNVDYSKVYFENYQKRIIYFGIQYRLNNFFNPKKP